MRNNLILLGLAIIAMVIYYYLTKPETVVIEQQPEVNVVVKAPKKSTHARRLSVDMVLIKGGSFEMGGDKKENEKPVHTVTLGDFYIGRNEVTQAQWTSVMGKNPSFRKGEANPVEKISWYETIKFCNRLSEINGYNKCYTEDGDKVFCDFRADGYRLPTEAEWEFAAAGGVTEGPATDFVYSGSDKIGEVAWYRSNSGMASHPVGGKKPNEIGVFDMSGNVWEWVWDIYGENYYSLSGSNDPKGPDLGHERIIRGGGWSSDTDDCRIANRRGENPYYSHRYYGFRLARTP